MFDLSSFGKHILDEKKMKERLPEDVFLSWKRAKEERTPISLYELDIIANVMKEWAIENDAYSYAHWFQPIGRRPAEKHEFFLDKENGLPVFSFKGKDLAYKEPDASSFPHGELRSTYEAKGYTYWDIASPVFIRNHILYIPSFFIGYHGETLDEKKPLMQSSLALSYEATRVLHLLGEDNVTSVTSKVGLEQEYFLLSKENYLAFSLFPKVDHDHYFASITQPIRDFMQEVDQELWELGIYVKAEHKEVAPFQYELSPLYEDVSLAIEQNLIIMEVLHDVAEKHHLICILKEKPFEGVNGSGKHNNWSLFTNTGIPLFELGRTRKEQLRFMLFSCALIKGIDEYPTLLRVASSSKSNEERLGGCEAPPSTISISLGKNIRDIFTKLIETKEAILLPKEDFNIASLSYVPFSLCDRNRTSPISFTCNKFEFRMLGSSMNASFLNTVIQVVLANALQEIANQLEQTNQIEEKIISICKEILKKHGKILFDGDGYSSFWKEEIKKRGLPHDLSYEKSLEVLNDEEIIKLFENFNIFTKKEIESIKRIKKM